MPLRLGPPPFTTTNVADRSTAHAEHSADVVRGEPGREHRADSGQISSAQLVGGALFASRHAVALNGIAHIVGVSPEPKMARADASLIVAVVKYPPAMLDRSIGQFPRDTMRHLQAAIQSEQAVAKGASRPTCSRSGPFPTSFALSHLCPKAIHAASIAQAEQYHAA